jgi:F-type H+-transporting ATPase subunit epsilon
MQVQLISPEKTLFEGVANYVQIPGILGEFGVLPNHAPFISTLKEGTVAIDLAGGEKKEFPVTGGVAEVQAQRVTILVA